MPSQDFIVKCLAQHTDQDAIEWFISDRGGYFTVIDGWSVMFNGLTLIYQKGPKIGYIIIDNKRLFSNDDPELRINMLLLIANIRKQVSKNKILEKQEEKIRTEFCASMLGWNKKT